jgi:hypothetical protein
MENERENRDEGEEAVASKGDLIRAKLGLIGHYLLLALAPTIALVALIFAVLAYTGSQSNRARLNEINTRIDNIKSIQSEPKGETDIFQVSLAREKALLAEERKKQIEKDAKIISNVTQLQVKLKVSPTLDEQLIDDAKAPVVAASVNTAPVTVAPATPAAAPVPVPEEKKPAAAAGVSAPSATDNTKKPAPAPAAEKAGKASVPAAKDSGKKPAAPPPPPVNATKSNALKKTIEEFNKIDRKK